MCQEYEWRDLWSATLGLVNFVVTKAGSIEASVEIGALIEEVMFFVFFEAKACLTPSHRLSG